MIYDLFPTPPPNFGGQMTFKPPARVCLHSVTLFSIYKWANTKRWGS